MKRRTLLKLTLPLSLSLGGISPCRRLHALETRSAAADVKASGITAFIDRLVPADPLSPGALDLGIQQPILSKIAGNPVYRHIVHKAMDWLDHEAVKQGGGDFASLPPKQQDALISRAEGLPREHYVNWAFRRLLADTLQGYYTRQETWVSLCYRGPPQPLGFPHYADPHTDCKRS